VLSGCFVFKHHCQDSIAAGLPEHLCKGFLLLAGDLMFSAAVTDFEILLKAHLHTGSERKASVWSECENHWKYWKLEMYNTGN